MQVLRQSRLVFLTLAILLAALYAFGLILGMYSLSETYWIAIIMAFGAGLFALHQWRLSKVLSTHEDEELARELHKLREKRGF